MASLKKQIMRRVYIIWFMRLALSPISLKIAAVFMLMWQFTAYVSVAQVFVNSPISRGDLLESFYFLKSAFMNTEAITLMLMVGIAFVGGLLVKDAIRRRTDAAHVFAQV